LDDSVIATLRAHGRPPGALLRGLLSDFLIEVPALLDDIESVGADADGDLVAGRALHKLTGASSFIGAMRLTAACRGLEDRVAARPDRSGDADARAMIRTEVDLVVGAVGVLLTGCP
jgi:hypothetical protein